MSQEHREGRGPEQAQGRTAYGQRASFLAIGANGLLFALKLLVGLSAGSVAIVADGVNNLSDAASNIISFLGFKLAARPADAEHPYGHGRYEYLAGLMVAVLILTAGLELFKSSLDRLLHPAVPDFSWTMAAVLAGSILVKLWMMLFQRRAGRRIASKTLLAASADSRNDAVATGVVLAGMAVSVRTGLDLDGWLGLGVAAFVLFSGFSLVRDTLDPLLGRAPEQEVIDEIRRRIEACPGVLATHDLMLHDYGPGRRFASAHVESRAEEDPVALHHALNALSREFLEKDGLHIIFQTDPISRADTEENRLRRHVTRRAEEIDRRLSVHDIEIDRQGEVPAVRFDCYAPPGLAVPEEELLRRLEAAVLELVPGAEVHVTVDRNYMAPPR